MLTTDLNSVEEKVRELVTFLFCFFALVNKKTHSSQSSPAGP